MTVRDDYVKVGYGHLWDTMADRMDFPPSFEVFSTGLFKNRLMHPAEYAEALVRNYNRTIC